MSSLKISLRAGGKIYVNGAVLRVDRKVSLEFLNSVTFLLEQHVLKPEDTTTPLRQLYFMVQMALMEPGESSRAEQMSRDSVRLLSATFRNAEILAELAVVADLLARDRFFESLRVIRKLFPIEDAILSAGRDHSQADRRRLAKYKRPM